MSRSGRFGTAVPVDDADSNIWEYMLKAIYDANKDGIIAKAQLDGELALTDGTRAFNEIRLTPKASSSGAEGTIFYDSDDDHVYVGTE